MPRLLWTTLDVDVPPTVAWAVFIDLDEWSRWGPSVRSATLDGGEFVSGATGRVHTVLGMSLPFTLTDVDAGRSWSWRVAGIPATTHTVDPLADGRCRVGMGVPRPAAPYLAVCRVGLQRVAGRARARAGVVA